MSADVKFRETTLIGEAKRASGVSRGSTRTNEKTQLFSEDLPRLTPEACFEICEYTGRRIP